MKKTIVCPVCHNKHKTLNKVHECFTKVGASSRGHFNEIKFFSVKGKKNAPNKNINAGTVLNLFRDCLVEEFAEFDKKGRGDAVNHDLYDYNPEEGVAIIQARHAFRRYRNGYLNVHKNYFLCGHNENGQPFRHPISANVVHAAIRTETSVVKAAQRWMWGVTEKQLSTAVRQGDVLIVPEKEPKNADDAGTSLTLANSHELRATAIRRGENGRIYALDPRLSHAKGQHAPVAMTGWTSIRVADEAAAWNFAERLGD